ncbi:DUF3325 domain-containing protein [Sphingomonas montana]|uniref:DUF3325 domain-containing protein n=1 Tax=Sphingomonas montana TaxID=1843236 RepID=UPI00096EB706|nr:DUF3325 domain-containing protein [Sphingomonas montana]
MLAELCLSYCGMAALALATYRLRDLRPVPVGPLRAAGMVLLAGALAGAVLRLGAGQGVVAFLATAGLAGIALVLILSARPRVAVSPLLFAVRVAGATRRPMGTALHPDGASAGG